jgi:hypothetical protein
VTLVSSIILDAYRESNMLALGKDPAPNQSTEALRLYNALIISIYGGEAGEPLTDWPLGNFGRADTPGTNICLTTAQIAHPNINRRLIALNEQELTVYLTLRPQDGSRMGIIDPFGRLASMPVTLDANGRTIEGSPTLVLDTDGLSREWFYRADKGDWVRLTSLTVDDENPFPEDFDTLFIILLAMRLSPRYGRALDATSVSVMNKLRTEFVARYLQSQPLEINDSISWPFMSTQSYDTQRNFSSNRAFESGDYPWPGA